MVKFIYNTSIFDINREKVITNIFLLTKKYIELPEYLEIEFKKLNPNIYGETLLDTRFKNRIRLNEDLTCKEVIIPLIHELLHLNQIFVGRLVGRRDGSFIWDKRVYKTSKSPDVREWENLPWEVDVAQKQQKLLEKVLDQVD